MLFNDTHILNAILSWFPGEKSALSRVSQQFRSLIDGDPKKAIFPFNVKKLYKIWFSSNPDCFMGIENKYRLFLFKKNNPKAEITLIYSSTLLTEKAQNELQDFCQSHAIHTVAFESCFPFLVGQDKGLGIYAFLEIKNFIKNQGGKLGAASDCARAILYLIKKYGIYSGFDNHMKFPDSLSTLFLNTPVWFPARAGGANCDFLALANDPADLNELHSLAIENLDFLQLQILTHYFFPQNALRAGLDEKNILDSIKILLIENYFGNTINEPTIFGFRQYIQKMNSHEFGEIIKSIFSASQDKTLFLKAFHRSKTRLYKDSVIKISGPVAYGALYHHLLEKEYDVSLASPRLSRYVKSQDAFLEEAKRNASINISEEEIDNHLGKTGDLSWAPLGIQKKAEREKQMCENITCIQHAFRSFKKRKNNEGKPVHLSDINKNSWCPLS